MRNALFIAYVDNACKCPDFDFPPLPSAWTKKFMKKFEAMLNKTQAPGEIPSEKEIDAKKLLTFDDPSANEETVR